jgi:hypothetical protein
MSDDGDILRVNHRVYPSEHTEYMTMTSVLVRVERSYYTVYVGEGSAEFVARVGDRMSYAEAVCHFPSAQLKPEQYRA